MVVDGRSLVAGDCEVPIDGGMPRRLPASDPRGLWVSSYSSDGTRVAYTTFTEDRSERSMTNSLVIADADGTELRVVPYPDSLEDGTVDNVFLHNLIWSPSGDRVAFTWTPLDVNGSSVERAAELRVLDVASGIVRTAAAKRSIRPIRFSPDGDRILFATDGGVDGTGLWSVDADGSDVQLVVPGAGWGDWQPRPPVREYSVKKRLSVLVALTPREPITRPISLGEPSLCHSARGFWSEATRSIHSAAGA